MPKTPRQTAIRVKAATLETLGAPRLAELLAEQARLDRGLRERLARALAEAAGGDALRDYVERRMRALSSAGYAKDVARVRVRLEELEALRRVIAETIAARDPAAALHLLRQLAEQAPTIFHTMNLEIGEGHSWLSAVLGSLAALWLATKPDVATVVDFVVDRCLQYEASPPMMEFFAPVLGDAGLLAVRDRLQAELGTLPAEPAGARWGIAGERDHDIWIHGWHLRRRLREVADVRGDVDGFIALEVAQPRKQVDTRSIIERLLKAGRGAEALTWLDDARYHNRLVDTTDLRLAALEAVGRRDDAQRLRWQRFEALLDRAALKDFLKHLPDFEDFEAERRAMAHALAFRSPTDALGFLVAWPDLDNAARLVRERDHAFGATPPETLLRAGEALRDRHPQEAVFVVRLAATAVLHRSLRHLAEAAAQALADSLALAPPAWPGADAEPHETFVDRLRQRHAWAFDFWRAFDGRTR